MALANEIRLKSKDFDKVKEKGRLCQSDDFGVCVYNRGDDKEPRFGFIVSSKISKLAVHRNRINRALSEAVRQNLDVVPAGFDMVFLVKKSIAGKTTDEIMKQAEFFLRKRKFLK